MVAINRRRQPFFRSAWNRTRTQLGGGLVLGALVPYIVRIVITPRLVNADLLGVSALAAVLAISAGYYFFRSLVAFPGIRASYYILPVFSSVFGLTVAIFLFLRLDYSRPLLAASYLITIGWYYLIYFKIQRQRNMSVGVVPIGDVASIRDIPSVTWLPLAGIDGSDKNYDAIVADFRADMPAVWERFLADVTLRGTPVYHVKQLRESLTGRVEIEHLSENAQGLLTPTGAYRKAKWAFDLIVAVLIVLPLGLAFVIIGVAIKLDSPGPVFFRQTRIGFRGERFGLWKLRTMAPATSTSDVLKQAMTLTADKRITRIGRVLRRSRIDELPQVFNILSGDMSWIGPRPEAEVLSRWYETEIPFYRYRHVVRPGISGWAQVNQGHVAELNDVNGKLHYDFYYIANFSLWLDVLITIRTVKTMMTGFGAK